ncbi:hypothetical protein [Streptomyces sp. NPDC059994]|uniref:hypothetical protein n=1 Tax=Streptomyces sp. NPDC059994 TaxID=3347029 RepID=UPI0036D00D49
MTPKTTMTAVDGTDALAFVIIRPGETPGGVSIEAAANGISKPGAAYVLRHVANGWDASADDPSATLSAFNTLAERYEEIAAKTTTDVGKQRATQLSRAAKDIRMVLTTGRIPHWLMTDAELEQYGTPEATS